MNQPDASSQHRKGLSKTLATAALTGATVVTLTLPTANADPTTPPPPPPPSGNTFLNGPPPPGGSGRRAPARRLPTPTRRRRRLPTPTRRPPPPAPEPGRVNNAAGGFSYVVPAGWKVSDATQLSYGQALLTKIPPPAPAGAPAPQPPTTPACCSDDST